MFERKDIISSNVLVCNMFLAKKQQNSPKKERIQQTTMNLLFKYFLSVFFSIQNSRKLKMQVIGVSCFRQ